MASLSNLAGRILWWLLTLPFKLLGLAFRLAKPSDANPHPDRGRRSAPRHDEHVEPRPFPVRVISVQDGDSLVVTPLNRGNGQLRVRLYGIDAPEHDQDFGREARERLSSLVRSRDELILEPMDTDRYGRMVGVLYYRKVGRQHSVNRLMVEQGLARWYSQYGGYGLGLERAEREAQRRRRGIWSAGRQVAPWDHRRAQRERASARRGLYRTLLLATLVSIAVVVAFYFVRQAL